MLCDLHGWRLRVRIKHPGMVAKPPRLEHEVSTELPAADNAHRGARKQSTFA